MKYRIQVFNMRYEMKPIDCFCGIDRKSIFPFPKETYTIFSFPAFDNNKTPEICKGDTIKSSKFLVKPNTILFNKLNVHFRRVWNIGEVVPENSICSTEFIPLKPKQNVCKDYLYYNLIGDDVSLSMYNARRGTSNSQQRIAPDTLLSFEIPCPPLEEQFKIASILKALDDKIQLNNEINNNLAEQSQAIFAEFMCKYPYELSPLGDMAEIIDCLHSRKPEAVDDTTYQLLQLNNITDSGFLDLSSKYYISKSDYENWTRKCEIVEGDCVITNVGRIGAVSQAPNGTHAAMGRNMTCIRLRKDKPFRSYLITALLSPHIRKEIMKNTDEGTIMGALNVKNIPLLLFPVFVPPVMKALEDLLYPIRNAIEQNYLSNQTLSLLRDSLLPRLMSGKIDVLGIDF